MISVRDIQLHICILLQYPHRDQETVTTLLLLNTLVIALFLENILRCLIFKHLIKF